ncbi:hypothetical protein HMPREF1861_00795 [Corynebacterium kroppenstedtii]|nr:hypothetical protein HMPREF1861_00795 [Corynebacterium kroppenstedtii]
MAPIHEILLVTCGGCGGCCVRLLLTRPMLRPAGTPKAAMAMASTVD